MMIRRLFVLAFAAAAFAVPGLPAFAKQDLTMPTCAAGDPVVWVNTKSKVYHEQGSSTYASRTKNGKYACTSDAKKMGARAAHETMKKGTAMSSSATPAPAASPTTKHRKARKGTMTPTPAPEAT